MTKSVKFDENGRRSEIEVQIFELNPQGPISIAIWDTEYGVKQSMSSSVVPAESDPALISLRNRTFIVLTALVIQKRTIPSTFCLYNYYTVHLRHLRTDT